MRKNTFVLALGLALSLGASEVVMAQASDTRPQQGEGRGPGQGGRRGRGGPEAMLLRGITLSADQRTRLDALRQRERSVMEARRQQNGGPNGQLRGQGQRPDSATMSQMRARFAQDRERRVSAIRDILTPDQRRTFDANVAGMRQREAQRDSVRRAGGNDGDRRGDRNQGQGQGRSQGR